MLQLTFNPGLTLTGFRTTRPRYITNIKQLLDEVEHDIMNYQNRGPKAEADNTDTRF